MRFLALLLAGVALPALAQDQGVQRQLIQRQQQSDAFQLQLRQSQELRPYERQKAEEERRPLAATRH